MPHSDTRERGPSLPTAQTSRLSAAITALMCLFIGLPATAAPPKTEIRIGAIVPESYPSAAQGQEIRNGMTLALKIWPGYPVPTLDVKDSACNPNRSLAAAQALVESKVDVVLGGWCEVGSVPAFLKGAGVPFVSSNAERYASADGSAQFGRIGANVADGIAARLRTETGLRVTANSVCWLDFEPRVSEKYDAALCPSLPIDRARWDEVAPTYTAAFQKPFTISAARGYAAMQVALAYITRLRTGAKPAAAWSDAQNVSTVLGHLPARDAAMPEDAMQLVLGAKLPKLPAREAGALDQMVKAKTCGCKAGTACAANGAWSALPFVVAEPHAQGCSPPMLTSAR